MAYACLWYIIYPYFVGFINQHSSTLQSPFHPAARAGWSRAGGHEFCSKNPQLLAKKIVWGWSHRGIKHDKTKHPAQQISNFIKFPQVESEPSLRFPTVTWIVFIFIAVVCPQRRTPKKSHWVNRSGGKVMVMVIWRFMLRNPPNLQLQMLQPYGYQLPWDDNSCNYCSQISLNKSVITV